MTLIFIIEYDEIIFDKSPELIIAHPVIIIICGSDLVIITNPFILTICGSDFIFQQTNPLIHTLLSGY